MAIGRYNHVTEQKQTQLPEPDSETIEQFVESIMPISEVRAYKYRAYLRNVRVIVPTTRRLTSTSWTEPFLILIIGLTPSCVPNAKGSYARKKAVIEQQAFRPRAWSRLHRFGYRWRG